MFCAFDGFGWILVAGCQCCGWILVELVGFWWMNVNVVVEFGGLWLILVDFDGFQGAW